MSTSRFDNLDDHLRRKEEIAKVKEQERIKLLLKAREECMPQVRRAYNVLGDYYNTILKPRKYKLFPRVKAEPTINEMSHISERTILYAYVANILSPRSEWPYPNEVDYPATWSSTTISEGDYHVWHPHIGLHFATILTPAPSSHQGNKVDLSIQMRAWGTIDIDKNSLVAQGINVSFQDAGWNHHATFIYIKPDEHRLENQVEMGLRLLTPNIINHKEAYNKQYS